MDQPKLKEEEDENDEDEEEDDEEGNEDEEDEDDEEDSTGDEEDNNQNLFGAAVWPNQPPPMARQSWNAGGGNNQGAAAGRCDLCPASVAAGGQVTNLSKIPRPFLLLLSTHHSTREPTISPYRSMSSVYELRILHQSHSCELM